MTEESTAQVSKRVTDQDTAAVWGEGFPAVASTPFVLGLAEISCHAAVAGQLPEGSLTVGTSASIEHLAPSIVGAELVARATLLQRDGARLTFSVTVADGERTVAHVVHQRAVVNKARAEAALNSLWMTVPPA